MQLLAPSLLLKVFAAHREHADRPATEKEPRWQISQGLVPLTALANPGSHAVHWPPFIPPVYPALQAQWASSEAPTGDDELLGHCLQPLAPVDSMYVP